MGKYGRISEAGHRGSSRGHKERSRSGAFMCERSKCNVMASGVPKDESNYERGAGAFLGDLRQS